MFCPLCLAEYRDGFIQCGDCQLGLVGSLDEAKNSSTRLWKGDRQRVLDKILDALDSADIPRRFEETVDTSFRVAVLRIPLKRRKSTFEYEVRILRSDVGRAQAAIAGLNGTSAHSMWDALTWESIARRFSAAFRKLLKS